MVQDQQNYYWLFSSSAQAISAFIAFLVTGYALVLNIMDGLQQQDETLEDIHIRLKRDHYRNIRLLSVITGLAIIFSLWMVYLNGGTWEFRSWLYGLTIILNLIAVLGGIVFVISIINPEKYNKAAKKIITEDKLEFTLTGDEVDQLTFMTEFIKLEKAIRGKLKDRQLYVPFGDTPKMVYSFRQMINALLQNELIDRKAFNDLLQINKYRNLVFHGHQDKVDRGMLDRVKLARDIVDRIAYSPLS